MKKFILCATLYLLSNPVFGSWSETDKQSYVNLMFNTAMEYRTYDNILTIEESIKTIHCIGDFYENNYTYNQFIDMFYNGPQYKVEEFEQINNMCIEKTRFMRQQNFKKIKFYY